MKPLVTPKEAEVLKKLSGALGTFKLLNETMPLQYALSFLAVAMDEGKSVKDYAEKLGVNTTTMSRHLLDIGPRNRNMEEGYGLIQYRANPLELRRHQFFLTNKGRRLVSLILKELE